MVQTWRTGTCCGSSVGKLAGTSKRCKEYISHTANSMKNGYDENNNYNKSDETKCATNYSFITNNNKWNVNTHNNLQLTMHNKYTNDDVHTNDCVVHIVR